jgi:hypothetical protein
MEFKVTVTTRAATMEKWIYRISEDFLCDASAKIVGLDCEFTDKVKGIKQKLLPEDKRQRAAVLQLCVANDIILFQVSQMTPYKFFTNCSELYTSLTFSLNFRRYFRQQRFHVC